MSTRTFELNSSLCPLVCVDMYETSLSPSSWEDNANESCSEDYGAFCRTIVNTDEYDRCVAEFCQEFLNKEILPILQPYGVKRLTAKQIYHPREYNFYTDQFDFDVEMQVGWKKLMRENLRKFNKQQKCLDYISEHYLSRSGFISFMPQSCEEIAEFEDEDRCLAAYLSLCLVDAEFEDLYDFFEDACMEYLAQHRGEFEEEINFLDAYVSEETAQRIERLYADDHGELGFAISRAMDKFGHAWRWDKYHSLESGYETLYAENDAMQCIFWAVLDNHTDILLDAA